MVVANIKSQIKRNRQNDKKRLRNRVFRGEARIAVRNARTTMEEGVPESKAALLEAISALDKAAEQGVIHKNNAARRKSRLMKAYAKMGPVKVKAESQALEPVLAAESAISSPKGKKKAAPKGKAASRKIVEEPQAEAAVESKTGPKKSSPKTKAAAKSSPKAKKAVAEKIESTPSPKSKKPETTSSPKGKTTSTRTSSPKGKKPAATK
jgi:small subunit ribosomal protein S20